MINLQNITKSFGQTQVLKGITLQVKAGEQCAVRGASGSGKSTLLHLIGGLDRPSSGKIFIADHQIDHLDDESLARYRNQLVGFVFQFHYLLPSMNCLENILLPAQIANVYDRKYKKKAKTLAERLGVQACLSKMPYQLSGGEQQRVNICRALILEPQLLLCDEPTGNLDSVNSKNVISVIKELAKEYSSTLLIVTHDDQVASELSRQIYILDGLVSASQ